MEEYKRAKEIAKIRNQSNFFAPVFIGKPETKAGIELRQYDGFVAKEPNEISDDNKVFLNWLGRVAVAGLNKK
jgi:hypothetical protein